MKFIPLLFVLGLATAHSQITTAGGAQVYVADETLVYSTGDITIGAATDKFLNKGNIRIAKGTFKKATGLADADAKDTFVLSFDDEDHYGQMIIESGLAADGIVSMERIIDIPRTASQSSDGATINFTPPFVGYTYEDMLRDLNGGTAYTSPPTNPTCVDGDRGCLGQKFNQHPLFGWNNEEVRFDPVFNLGSNPELTPGTYYSVIKSRFSGIDWTAKKTFYGKPNVANKANEGDVLTVPSRIAKNIDVSGKKQDRYGVYFYTYLADPFVPGSFTYSASTTKEEADAAQVTDNYVQLINPYTSNIVLERLLGDYNNVSGVGSYGKVTTRGGANSRYTGNLLALVPAGGGFVGDFELQYIPPMTNFFIKMNNSGSTLNLYDPAIQTFEKSAFKMADANGAASNRNARTVSGPTIRQLKLILNNKDQTVSYGHTYVASSSDFVTGENLKQESISSLNKRTGIYTIPESKTGGPDPNLANTRLYTNVMSSESAKVAIPLGIDVRDKEEAFTFTAALAENGRYLPMEKINYDSPDARFYLRDKGENGDQNIIKEITTDFSYTFTQTKSSNDRFEIFWKESGLLGNQEEDLQPLTGLTTVYKTGNDHKVRFDTNWQKANVTIFNVMGQLISSEKNIPTQDDYLLPIYGSSSTMYIVVIENEKGEKVTKKIVK